MHRPVEGLAAAVGDRIALGFVAEKWHGAALVAYLQEPAAHYADVRMPNLKVSEGDAADLAAYLLAGQVDLAAPKGDAKKGRRLVQKSGCVLCHAFGDDVPPADRVFPRYRNLKPERGCLADEPSGAAPQFHLDDEERAALRAFLPFGGKLPSPRPWMTARMPKFERHGAALTDGLVREHGYGKEDEPILAGKANLAMHGQRLLAQGTGFGCVQCHAVGDNKATQVFEREGINLAVARGRLRHEYYTRWLADPTRLDPDARMPKYADDKGKTAFTDVLGGKAADQFEAIWQFLGDKARK